jgi:hypothetical protein
MGRGLAEAVAEGKESGANGPSSSQSFAAMDPGFRRDDDNSEAASINRCNRVDARLSASKLLASSN